MNNKNLNLALVQKHPYHLVDPSPWPILTSFSVFMFACGGLLYMHSYKNSEFVLILGLFFLFCCISCWWRDVIRESTFEGHHTKVVQIGLSYGMILFIVSEISFFGGFFWAFFHERISDVLF